jgi:DNA mismatch repair ATPase MutS
MATLEQIISLSDLRHNGIVHVVANFALLWDVWCALLLDRWRKRAGGQARQWLRALGEVEALSSIATFSWEHPAFSWPVVVDSPPHFEADALGHPLVLDDRRVANDVVLPEPGTALLVTGSNMSGKSTLLRAIGVNAVLALAGAPACARKLRMANMEIMTSMRITDSLEHGVSHFYAELARLKTIVDAVLAGRPVLFLLDEVLHGTNSRERQIGAKAIVAQLIGRGAVGAVSSHDVGLAELEDESGGRVKNVHFEELATDGRMTFDYVLKPGVVTSGNALRLMRHIGLAVELPEDERR